ncbi:MAG: hypothetical protein K2I44_10160 [Muribaculaceae bacterium]|nr:hypothetical protein [Muribaculaceae bacterium]
MAIEEVLTYLQDVLDAINNMESCFVDFPNRYDLFEKDIMRKCVVERKTEIMGEASQLKFEQTINGYFRARSLIYETIACGFSHPSIYCLPSFNRTKKQSEDLP